MKSRAVHNEYDGTVTRTKILRRGRNGCPHKMAYSSRKTAAAAARAQSNTTGERIEAYHCFRCHCWHIGHPPGTRRSAAASIASDNTDPTPPGRASAGAIDGTAEQMEGPYSSPLPTSSAAPLPHEIPMQGDTETTTVKARGCPGADAGSREHNANVTTTGRRPEPLTGQTSQEGYRQTPQGESNGCQHGPIHVPADGNTTSASHGRAGVADPSP